MGMIHSVSPFFQNMPMRRADVLVHHCDSVRKTPQIYEKPGQPTLLVGDLITKIGGQTLRGGPDKARWHLSAVNFAYTIPYAHKYPGVNFCIPGAGRPVLYL